MRIGELAKNGNISVSTIRFYERQGLLPKPETTESGYREYTRSDLARLRLIVAAKRRRFPLKMIKLVVQAVQNQPEPCGEIAEMVEQRIKTIGREIHDLQRLQAHLSAQLEAWKRGTLPKDECLCAILERDALIETQKETNK